jgi:hypothetical protein
LATAITLTLSNLNLDNINFALEQTILAPQLLLPTSDAVISTNPPLFTWSSVSEATHYEIQIGRDSFLNTSTIQVNSTSYQPSTPLLTTIYFWRVRSVDASQNYSDWSETRAVTLSSPSGAPPISNLVTTRTPTLSWSQVSWAIQYEVQVDSSPGFGTAEVYIVGPDTLSVTSTQDLGNGIHYWQVRAQKSDGSWGAWSTLQSFVVDVP